MADEFWVEPLQTDGHVATVQACFNEFTVTISVERKDGGPISELDAERAYNEVIGLIPSRVRFRPERPAS